MDCNLFNKALEETRRFHQEAPACQAFGALPSNNELTFISQTGRYLPGVDHFASDKSLSNGPFEDARQAFLSLKDQVFWRAPYANHTLGATFSHRFCVFELIGLEGCYHTPKLRGFVFYLGENLYYPWHHHPAEELYFILAGNAQFMMEGQPSQDVSPGDCIYHAKNVPHATKTRDSGILAWVQWRGDLVTPPVFTDRLNGS